MHYWNKVSIFYEVAHVQKKHENSTLNLFFDTLLPCKIVPDALLKDAPQFRTVVCIIII